MIVLLVAVVAVACVLGGCFLLLQQHGDGQAPDLDSEAATQAAIELHAVQRKVDVAMTKVELRRGAANTRKDIEEALRDHGRP